MLKQVPISDRVNLRPLKSSDAEAFMTWASDSEVTQSLFWDAHKDLAAAREFLLKVAKSHPWFMAIEFDQIPVGAITLDRGSNRATHRAELGYVIAKKFWGLGIASEAVKQALRRGFNELGVARIEAFVDPQNLGSVKVLEKSEMVFEGVLKNYVIHRGKIRDRKIFALTKDLK